MKQICLPIRMTIICRFCKSYNLPPPRRYKKCARKDYLAFARSKKHSAKKIRKALRKQLGYVARDIRYLEEFMSNGYAATEKEAGLYLTITALYEQQKYMYGRIEKISFEAYNESTCLTEAVERFKERTGYYPNRVLANQIYRTRANRNYCKEHGIRLSGPKLGRPGVNVKVDKNRNIRIFPTASRSAGQCWPCPPPSSPSAWTGRTPFSAALWAAGRSSPYFLSSNACAAFFSCR